MAKEPISAPAIPSVIEACLDFARVCAQEKAWGHLETLGEVIAQEARLRALDASAREDGVLVGD